MKTLRDALEEGDLESFIKEHESDPDGDLDKVDEVIRRSGQETASEARQSSRQESSDD